ncbi:MAG: CRISPR-associated ring nuclease Crn3/Csx3 [Candidatus Omnitrophica bacterium]|nr:CRISPR-associated ring nuclease Crn3/Csx3 [Candidatus Omnitrophota bacterium]
MEFLNDFIKFSVKNKDKFALIEFELIKEIEPSDLGNLNPPDPVKEGFSSKVIILSGRGPIWLYGCLIHFYHPTKAIAIYDPRLNGAVIIETHSKDFKIGQLIKKEEFL